MLRETSVVAVAGVHRLFLIAWAMTCAFSMLLFGVFASLKVLGLMGAMVMITIFGTRSPEQVQAEFGVHVIITIVMAALAICSYVLFRRAVRRISTPFVDSVREAASLVQTMETGARSSSASIMMAAKQAIEEARAKSDDDPS
jgi:hypothetical protein